MKPKLEAYFKDYDAYHRHPRNKLTHLIGIPLIVLSIFGLLGPIWGLVLWAAVNLWYLTLDVKLGLGFAVVSLGLYAIGQETTTTWLWILFVAGWITQGIGHWAFEKKSPAFFKNFTHLLIGPLWILQGLTHLAR